MHPQKHENKIVRIRALYHDDGGGRAWAFVDLLLS